MTNPYKTIAEFEEAMAKYTGSPYAVAIDSGTNALFLCCKYLNVDEVTIPKKTYVSVPCAVINAGGKIKFEDLCWDGQYQLKPYPIWDSAIRLNRNMYLPNTFQCLSFHYKKHIPIGKGGMILSDDENAVRWFKKARFNGRNECNLMDDKLDMIGWNCYMTPEQASRGLHFLMYLPDHNDDKQEIYPDLSSFVIYE